MVYNKRVTTRNTNMTHNTTNNEMTAKTLLEILGEFPNEMVIDLRNFDGNLCSGHGTEYRDGKLFFNSFTVYTHDMMTVGSLCNVLESLDGDTSIMIPVKGGDYKLASDVRVLTIRPFGSDKHEYELYIV